jgi:DNA-binding response OmpR family regulator
VTDQLAIIRKLTRERDEARDRCVQLLEQFGGIDWEPPPELRLRPRMRQVLGVLVRRRGLVSRDQIILVLEAFRVQRDELDPKNVDVYVCQLRKILTPHGIEIETQWGIGWRLLEPGRQKLLNWGKRAIA